MVHVITVDSADNRDPKPFIGVEGESVDALVIKTPWLMNRSLDGI